MLGCWKYGHVAANLRKDSDSRHGIIAETGNSAKKRKNICERFAETQDFLFQLMTVSMKLVDVVKTLAELNGLFRGNSAVNSGLNFRQRSFAALVHELCNIEMLTGMSKDGYGNERDRADGG